jgi:cell division protein FtsL
MIRMFTFLAVGLALLSAGVLYAVSHQTRQIAVNNVLKERQIQKLSRDIAILRAERAFLMRPERIEPLARKLGMRPVRGRQFMLRSELQTHIRRP